MVKINPIVDALPVTIPFVAPEETERVVGAPFLARIGANEGNFGPSRRAIEAMVKAAQQEAWHYCDPTGHDLRHALASHLGLDVSAVVLGAGIDNLLGMAIHIFSAIGDPVIVSRGGYPTFNYHVDAQGRRLVPVPYAGFHEDLDALSAAARREQASIVYLVNPDNPMGTWWSASDIIAFAHSLPETTLLILDEAYAETAPADAVPAVGALPANVLRVRTFSKAYSLAGLRVGYGFGDPELMVHFDKVRDHFGVNIVAQHAALEALKDQDHLQATVAKIKAARDRIAAIGLDNGLNPVASATNFVTMETQGDGSYALRLVKALMDARIFVRKPVAPGHDHCIRVSAGRPAELAAFEEALPKVL